MPDTPGQKHPETWIPPEDLTEAASDEKTPVDILHNIAGLAISMPHGSNRKDKIISELAQNPSTASHTLTDLHNALKSHKAEDLDDLKDIVFHPNAPAAIAEDHLKSTFNNAFDTPGYSFNKLRPYNNAIKEAAKKPGVDHGIIQGLLDKYINDDNIKSLKETNWSTYFAHQADIDPNYYANLMRQRPMMHPIGAEHLTPEEISHNRRVQKIDEVAIKNLINSTKHTPETLHFTTEMLNNPQYGQDISTDTKQDFVTKQPNLTSEQLDSLMEDIGHDAGYTQNELNSAILEHPNASPLTLAKIARGDFSPRLKRSALSHPKLPKEALDACIDAAITNEHNRLLGAALDSPNLTADDYKKIFNGGDNYIKRNVAQKENAPAELAEQYWDQSDGSTEPARHLLKNPKLSNKILKELVNHRNQDLAQEALDHPNINEETLESAVKRRAPAVANKAARHPLMVNKYFDAKVKEGKIKGSELLFDETNKNAIPEDKIPEYHKLLNQRYSTKTPEELKETPDDVINVKQELSNSPHLSPEERNKNKDDILNEFKKQVSVGSELRPSGMPGNRLLTKYVETNAKEGHKPSQELFLSHPSFLRDISLHKGFDSDFLRQAYNAFTESDQTRHLPPASFDALRSEIATNLATPDDTFEKIIFNDRFNTKKDFLINSHETDIPASEGVTVYDRRWRNDPQKQEKYEKLLQADGGEFGVIYSKDAPDDVWNKTFQENPTARNDFLRHESYVKQALSKADPDTMQKMLTGAYNLPSHVSSWGKTLVHPQLKAIESLQPTEESVQQLKNIFDSHGVIHGNAAQANLSSIVDSIPQEIIASPLSDELIKHCTQTGQDAFALELLSRKILNKTITEDTTKDFANHLQHAGLEGLSPEQKQEVLSRRYMSLVNLLDTNSTTKEVINRLSPASTGALDFLANPVHSDADINDHIRKNAIGKNLISSNKINELASLDPSHYADSLRSMNKFNAAENIRKTLRSSNIHPEILSTVADHLHNGTFNIQYRSFTRGRPGETELSAALPLVENLGKQLAANDLTEDMQKAAYKLINTTVSNTRGGFSKTQNAKIAQSFIDGVKNQLADQPIKQNKALLSIFKYVKEKDAKAPLPNSIITEISKNAVESNDIDSLLYITQLPGKHPAAVKNSIKKIIKNPEILSNDQLENLSNSLEHLTPDVNFIKSIGSTFKTRFANTPEQKKINQSVLSSLYNNFNAMHSAIPESSPNRPKIEAAMLSFAMEDKDINGAQNLMYSLCTHSSDNDIKKAAYLALPDSKLTTGYPALTQTLYNDPEIMQSSTSGWRLNMLVNASRFLNKENRSILVERLTNLTSDSYDVDRVVSMAKLASYSGTEALDCIRMYRSLTTADDKLSFLDELNTQLRNSRLEVNCNGLSTILPHINSDLQNSVENLKLTDSDVQQNIHYINNLFDSSSEIIKNLQSKDFFKNPNNQSFTDTLNEFSDNVINHINFLTNRLYAHISTNEHHIPLGQSFANSCLKSLTDITQANNLDVDYMSVFNTVDKIKSLHSFDPTPPGGFVQKLSTFCREWCTKAQANSEEWATAFQKMPELQFSLGHRPSISTDILKNINFQQMVNLEISSHAVEAITNIFDKIDNTAAPMVPNLLKKFGDTLLHNNMLTDDYVGSFVVTIRDQLSKHPTAFSKSDIKSLFSYERIRKTSAEEDLERIAIRSGAGGRDFFVDNLNKIKNSLEKDDPDYEGVFASSESPHVNEQDADFFSSLVGSKKIGVTIKTSIAENLLKKQNTPEKVIHEIYSTVNKEYKAGEISSRVRKTIVNLTMQNKNLSRTTFFQLYEDTKDMFPSTIESNKDFNPALVNSRFGGELFRSLPLSIPKNVKNVNSEKLITQVKFGEKQEKIKQALQFIPAEGIAWAQFKKIAPKLENVPEIKAMFMAKNNKPVTPENVAEEMRKFAPDEFHVTYSMWNGMQRHMSDQYPNLVVQLNTSAAMESQLNQDPKLWNFFQFVQKAANRVQVGPNGAQVGGHPVTPHIASWVRIDTGAGKEGWIVEEFQSDFSAKLRRELGHFFLNRSSAEIDGIQYTKEEADNMVKHIEKVFKNWVDASYEAIEELAKKQGVKKLYVHGQGVRRSMSGVSENKKIEVFDEAYEKQPIKRGFKKCLYSDYPRHSNSIISSVKSDKSPEEQQKALHCWVKELT